MKGIAQYEAWPRDAAIDALRAGVVDSLGRMWLAAKNRAAVHRSAGDEGRAREADIEADAIEQKRRAWINGEIV